MLHGKSCKCQEIETVCALLDQLLFVEVMKAFIAQGAATDEEGCGESTDTVNCSNCFSFSKKKWKVMLKAKESLLKRKEELVKLDLKFYLFPFLSFDIKMQDLG